MDDLDLGQTLRGFRAGQKVFGRYTLKKILGRGGMGVVWLAQDEKLARAVALKFLPDLVRLDARALHDLKRETTRSLDLTHANIVRIYDLVDDADSAAIAMEYVEGATLSDLAIERPHQVFTVAELKPLVGQLCAALSYAHEHARVVHRDLKPANIMLDAAGRVKVADFGISASLADTATRISQQSSASGTPLYMSPQQMMGDKPAASDDLYSLGATLYELLTGKPPFYTGNVLLQVQTKVPPSLAVRRDELGIPADYDPIPAAWETTIAALLAKDAAVRPSSASEVARLITAPVVGGVALQPPPQPKPNAQHEALGPTATGPVTVQFSSTPPGARVRLTGAGLEGALCIDGSGKEYVTPFSAELTPGAYHAHFSKEDYGPVEVDFIATMGELPTVEANLPAAKQAEIKYIFTIMVVGVIIGGALLVWGISAKNTESAPTTIKTAVESQSNTPEALYKKGLAYYNGDGVAKDPTEAVKLFRIAAEKGLAPAQFYLGKAYYSGAGIAEDPVQAVAWFRKAADQGNADAKWHLGNMYENGTGVAKDPVQAVAWYQKAADQGDAHAQANFGRMYQYGDGVVAKDPVQAVAWFRKAADQGYAPAQSNLGRMYQHGEGVAKDPVQAFAWYQKAANQGYADAQFSLGLMYETGKGVAKDLVQAAAWYRKAADQGEAYAQGQLGEMYEHGDGVAKDPVQAAAWYRKAADQGNPFAQCNLSFAYWNEAGVDKDDSQAANWARKAADQNNAQGQYLTGWSYQFGRGVTKDTNEAMRWYKLSADQGDESAKQALETLSAQLSTASFPISVATTTAAAPKVGQPYTIPGLNLMLMPIAAGTFTMGSPESESGRDSNEGPQTRVTISRPFWLGKYVVTQAEWTAVMGSNPSIFKGEQLPVEQVSYGNALAFCAKLTERERAAGRLPSGYVYTLPTEAQWEYACRAGTTGAYAGTGNWDDMGWYIENSANKFGPTMHPVGQKRANAWGLYDMHGNVWEWCADWYAEKLPGGSVTDPRGANWGCVRVSRGGCHFSPATLARAASRGLDQPYLGIRLALSSPGGNWP